eukprot:gene22588-1346_t
MGDNGDGAEENIMNVEEKYPFEVDEALPKTKGGYYYNLSSEALKAERSAALGFMKKLGGAVLDGKDLVSVSLPVIFFEPRSFLERLSDNWKLAPIYMKKAVQAESPVERLKYVVTFVIAGLHFNVAAKKPFNPILGETFQARLADGTRIMSEQTAHHPPVSSWDVRGPKEYPYRFTGEGCWNASMSANSVKGKQDGRNVARFEDGTEITWALPGVCVSGVMMGSRTLEYQGEMVFLMTSPRGNY